MNIKNLNLKGSYTGRGERILQSFLLPVLSIAKKYDRITGYFTIESLLAISQGIESLWKRKGKMRLIVGVHSIPADLIDAFERREYLKKEIEKLNQELKKHLISISDALEKKRILTLAWMIEEGLLEIKAASMQGEGIFHPKTLIVSDEEGFTVAAVGSSNETSMGLGGNYEQLVVMKSWEDSDSVNDQKNFFEDLWSNKDDDVTVLDISEVIDDLVISTFGNINLSNSSGLYSNNMIHDAALMPSYFFVSGDIPALYMHQERAVIDALSRWPVRVLFADEVGLGKTFEAAATLAFLIKYCEVKRVVILTPKAVLKQWQEELYENFNISMWLYDSNKKKFFSPENDEIDMRDKNPFGPKSPKLILMSAQYVRGTGKKASIFDRKDTVLPDLLIVDEAHSARVSEDIGGGRKKTRMYKVLENVIAKIPHVVLATATPMQKDAHEYHAMLKLLGLPKAWRKERLFLLSLKLIASQEIPDSSDAYTAAGLLISTIKEMKPTFSKLSLKEQKLIETIIKIFEVEDAYDIGQFVQNNWYEFRKMFLKFHPAYLLTVRNTRRSLKEVGYIFPVRNLKEVSISDSMNIQLFYVKIDDYLSNLCFSVEKIIYPDRNVNLGFVRISYRQRVASSLHACRKSLQRRYSKIVAIKDCLEIHQKIPKSMLNDFESALNLDVFDEDDLLEKIDWGYDIGEFGKNIDFDQLNRVISIECTSLIALIQEAERILEEIGDPKIQKSVKIALDCIENQDSVLVFSRYTDTLDSIIDEFKKQTIGLKNRYGIYSGKQSVIVDNGKIEECDKNRIKRELLSNSLKIVFCSDAASEGLNLQAARVLINVDVPWTPARLEQRIGRIARLGQIASEVDIYNVWYPNSIEARMYKRIQKRLEQSNLAIGEFPEVLANSIRNSVIDGTDEEDNDLKELLKLRNSYQTKALKELWFQKNEKLSASEAIRKQLLDICSKKFEVISYNSNYQLKTFILPDGSIQSYTCESGSDNSIALKSYICKYLKISNSNIKTINGSNGLPAAFVNMKDANMIKHEEIFSNLEEVSRLEGRPIMLPNFNHLDLSFMVETEIPSAPDIWIKKEEQS